MRRLKVVIWAERHLEDIEIIRQYVDLIQQVFGDHDVSVSIGSEPDAELLQATEVLICWDLPESILAKAPNLEWVQFGSSGINHAMSEPLRASTIRITTLSGVHAIPMAEHAIALMLAYCRKLPRAMVSQHDRIWERKSIAGEVLELDGSTVGVIGAGNIGVQVAAKCRGLGCRIVATRSSRAPEDTADVWVERDDLAELVSQSDWIVICTPYTPATDGMISREVLAKCKPGSVIVNIARGQVIDEQALIRELETGNLGGACLDVFCEEPLPADSALWSLPNVIITPHTGGSTPCYPERSARIVARNLQSFLSAYPMPTEYNRDLGY